MSKEQNNNLSENTDKIWEDEFDKIWDEVILILLDEIKNKYELKSKNIFLLKLRAKNLYDKYRSEYLNNYMYYDAAKIDKHKVASCLTKVILVTKPIRIPFKDKLRIRFKQNTYKHDIEMVLLVNQYLALSTAITVVEGYIDAHHNKHDESQPLNHRIVFPTPFPVADRNYLRDVCLDLYYICEYIFFVRKI